MPLLVEIGLTDLSKAWGAAVATPAAPPRLLQAWSLSINNFVVKVHEPRCDVESRGEICPKRENITFRTSMNLFFSLHPSISGGVGWVLN